MLDQLRNFQREHGHCAVPQSLGTPLAGWTNTMRKVSDASVAGHGSPFESLTSATQHYKWLRDERERRRLQEERGGGAAEDEDEDQARGDAPKRRKPKSSLTAERIQQLSDLGFQFSLRRDRNYTWEERFDQLRAAKDAWGVRHFRVEDVPHEEGHEKAPGSRARGHDLRTWLEKQGELHTRIRHGKPVPDYAPDRLRRLRELGLVFPDRTKKDRHWERRFADLVRYREEHGDCRVPKAWPGGLGEWVQQQRRQYGAAAAKAAEEGAAADGGEGGGGDGEGRGADRRAAPTSAAARERFARLQEVGFVFAVKTRRWRKKPQDCPEG